MPVVHTLETNHTESATRLPISRRKKKWVIVFVVVAVSLLLLNFMLQFLVRGFLTQQLEELGAHNPTIDSLSWSILRSNAQIKNVSWEKASIKSAAAVKNPVFYLKSVRINWRWNSLLSKQIVIDNLTIQQLHTRADFFEPKNNALAQWSIGGLDLSHLTKKKSDKKSNTKPWPILIHRSNIQDLRLKVHQPKKQLTHLKLSLLAKHLTTSSNQSAFVVADLSVNNSVVQIRGHTQNPSYANKNSGLSIAFDDLPISLIQPWLPANHSLTGTLGAILNIEWLTAHSKLQARGISFLKAIRYKQPNLTARTDLDWNGAMTFHFDKGFSLNSIQHQGTLKLNKINISQPESGIIHSIEKMHLDLDSTWKKTFKTTDIDFKPTSKFFAQGLKISADDLFDSKSISLDELNLAWHGNTNQKITLTHATVQKLKILDPKSTGLFFDAQLDTATWLAEENHLKIGNILIDNLEIGIQRTKDNAIEPVATLNSFNQTLTDSIKVGTKNSSGGSSDQRVVKSSQTKPLLWEIESIAVSEQLHSIHWQDNFVDKPVKINIALTIARMESISLDQPFPWNVQWQIPPAKGKANGLLDLKNKHWRARGSLNNLNLIPLSPYITEATGYGIDTGLTNVSAELKANPYTQGEIKIKLKSLDLSTVNKRRALAFSKDLTMPLDLALSTLKNKKGDIRFTVPIKIKNNASNVDVIPIINQALTRALRNAALNYLKYSLQPYGSILFLAEKANSAATALQLGAVQFEPGSAALSDTSSKLLARVAKMMRNRPNLRIKICTITNQADEEYIQARTVSKSDTSIFISNKTSVDAVNGSQATATNLDLLAQQRKVVVQNRLMEKSDFASRIFDCRAKHSTSKKPARVEIQLTNS
ncbi:MAG: DUF748 domain-containing protein [Pseudomonadota bacterium]